MQKEFSYPIKIDELGHGEQHHKLSADNEELKILTEILQVPAVNSFNADIKLNFQKKKGLLNVSGKVEANLKLISVVSLEEFNKDYKTDFKLLYDTTATYEDIYSDDEDINLDLPDIITDGKIDLADIAIEQLALILEDYPRQEGEVFNSMIEDDTPITHNPFMVLKNLKK